MLTKQVVDFRRSCCRARASEIMDKRRALIWNYFNIQSNQSTHAKCNVSSCHFWLAEEDVTPATPSTVSHLDSEISEYSSLPRSNMALKDPVCYWKSETRFPALKNWAKQVLSAPASSVRSERVFSTSGNVLSEKRNRLNSNFSEILVLLHDNLPLLK